MDLFNSFKCLLRGFIIALVLCSAQNAFSSAAEKWDYEVKPDRSKNIVLIEAKKVDTPAANDATYRIRVSPSKTVVARTMMRRLFRRANPLIGVSTMAVEALLSSYGYKIDNDEQVIYKEISKDQSLYYWHCYGSNYTNINELTSCVLSQVNIISHGLWIYKNPQPSISENGKDVQILADRYDANTGLLIAPNALIETVRGQLNPNANPNPERQILTEAQLGDIMFGRHPETGADTGVWTGVKEAYERIPNEQSKPDEAPYFVEQTLEKSNPDSNSTEITHTDPETGKQTNSALPNFCDWATPICSFVEWFKDDSDIPEPEKYTITELDKSKLPTAPQFNFNNQCPAPKTFTLNLGMASTQISLPYDYFCSFAVDVRPFVILAAWLHACYIFVGFVRS
ncbi:virulence factor TspB C-terminal domain-related protein [Acinetobacter sp. HR7]|uniref:virulence factor TspB C-terminal domain-related protein n=1 Tax=Acinetobacter sp. HR7 TaxID=1509403 RepID=UPI000536B811|nr:virulence factor TspB C-terminal domain-related protein [Acinetobacter sp. HR7]KGT48125.1 hypothetical protein GW12_08400 [Acinetobacter sp. HR7]